MPSPRTALKRRNADPGVTNIRNVKSPHWRHWLGAEHRCVVPFTSFSENEAVPDGSKPPVWFAFDDTRPLAFFAGLWTNWTSVRKVKEGETTNDLFGFLTTEPNKGGRRHPSQGNAGHPDDAAGNRSLDDRARKGGAETATAACRWRSEDRCAGRQGG
jgi:hypothetical protein